MSSPHLIDCPLECLLTTLPVSQNCFYHLPTLVMRWFHTIIMYKFMLNLNNGFKFCVPEHGLCFLLGRRHYTDCTEHTIKVTVHELKLGRVCNLFQLNCMSLQLYCKYKYNQICFDSWVARVWNLVFFLVDSVS